MKERPILFTTEMVKAIQDGRKTQTRRVIKTNNSIVGEGRVDWNNFCWDGSAMHLDTCHHGHTEKIKAPLPFTDGRQDYQYLHVPFKFAEDCTIYRIYPKWDVGDRLWVRETWWNNGIKGTIGTHYKATCNLDKPPWKWKSARFMPKANARLWLEITGIRVERVQDISLGDISKEGIESRYSVDWVDFMYKDFQRLWNSINAKRGYSWELNPWVWVIEFKAAS